VDRSQLTLDRASEELRAERAKVLSLQRALLQQKEATKQVTRLTEDTEITRMMDQKARIQEQNAVQKAQLERLIQENMVLQQSLEEMAKECSRMSDLLRAHLPSSARIAPELHTVLAKMEGMAKAGALAHVRLNKDARLREIRAATRADLEVVDSAPSSPVMVSPRRLSKDCAISGSCATQTLSSTSFGQDAASSAGRTSTQTSLDPSFSEAGGVVTRIAGAQNPAHPLPPVKVKRGQQKTGTPRTTTSLDITEQCANLAVGSRGGFALMGGPPGNRRTLSTNL
jgi:hypothetical protein